MNAPIKIRDLFLFLSLCIVIGCDQDFDYTNIPIHIIPEPLQIDLKVPQNDEKSSLDIDLKRLHFISADPKLLNQNILNNWVTQAQLRNATQRGLTDVKFELDLNKSKDEHWISINKNNIEIRGGSKEALFQGLQTLRQIFDTHDDRYISIPLAEIFDRPRFPYRGMHLDVCRHFFSVEFIKKYIDLLAYHKFNTFHWHLTEDQGWRIEIKKYPKLAEISAYRNETLLEITNKNKHFTYVTDRKLKDTPNLHIIEKLLQEKVTQLNLNGIQEIDGAGSVLNAIKVLENGPACMLKLPKKEKGGGSIWDFAATTCIYNELGLPATNFNGGRLDLNQKNHTYMHEEGVFFGNWNV